MTGQGYHFGGEKAHAMLDALKSVATANKSRKPCRFCRVAILPENLAAHERICGEAA